MRRITYTTKDVSSQHYCICHLVAGGFCELFWFWLLLAAQQFDNSKRRRRIAGAVEELSGPREEFVSFRRTKVLTKKTTLCDDFVSTFHSNFNKNCHLFWFLHLAAAARTALSALGNTKNFRTAAVCWILKRFIRIVGDVAFPSDKIKLANFCWNSFEKCFNYYYFQSWAKFSQCLLQIIFLFTAALKIIAP